MSWWRAIGLAGCAAAGIAALVLAFAGGDGTSSVRGEGAASGAGSKARTGPADVPVAVEQPARRNHPAHPGDAAGAALPASAARSAARLFLIGFGGTDPTPAILGRVAAHEWGGVVLEPGNGRSPQQVAGLVGSLRGAAQGAHHAAPIVAASQLGGEYDAVPIGSPLQSAAPDAAAARHTALGAAKALRALGIRLVLAPVADTETPGGPWEGLAFSDDPGAVTTMSAAAVAGWKEGLVAPAPGHFPGEGAASGDPVEGPATVGLSTQELRRRDLRPFAALARQAPAIQLSSATYVAFDGVTPATLLPEVVTVLRDELRFRGVIVSGDLAAASLATGRPVAELAVAAVKAGCDLLWIPGDAQDQDAARRAVTRALRTGDVPAARVAGALRRVSALRIRYGVN